MKLASEILKEMVVSEVYHPSENRRQNNVALFIRENIKNSGKSKKNILISIDVSESIGYKYIDGRRAIPRDVFIKFMIEFEYQLDQIQFYLHNFEYANLNIKNKRDSAIIYGLINNYSYFELKQYLKSNDIKAL